ncbi:hypothetical protein D1007_56071 [Hordeum vulgare]|nr:hypothetical protein D1007_56071 [Hordeum vulgare]
MSIASIRPSSPPYLGVAWSWQLTSSLAISVSLMVPFSHEEVWTSIKGMNLSSILGPDGLPVKFSHTFWNAIRHEVMAQFEEFYVGSIGLHRLIYGIITLIPKVTSASDIRHFHPIIVINVIFCIPAKGYAANRVTPLAECIAHPNQSVFITDRYILDGVLVFHEVLHEVRAKHHKVVFLKIDFHKAYGTVSWSFLQEVLLRKVFDDRWVARVLQLVSSGQTVVNINGEIGPYFPTLCGVRRGDPISPFLFNMVVYALVPILDKSKAAGHIQGVAPTSPRTMEYPSCSRLMTPSSWWRALRPIS